MSLCKRRKPARESSCLRQARSCRPARSRWPPLADIRRSKSLCARAWPSWPQETSSCPLPRSPARARFGTPMAPCLPRWWSRPAASRGSCPRPPTALRLSMLPSQRPLQSPLRGPLQPICFSFPAGFRQVNSTWAEPALERAGATFHFTGVKMQPGKPAVFGEFSQAPTELLLRI